MPGGRQGRRPISGVRVSREAAHVRSRGAVRLWCSWSSKFQEKGPLVIEVRGETRAKMNPFNLLLGRRKCLEGGGDGERKTRETLTLGVTTGELPFPFLFPSLLGSWHPRAQVTTSLGISLGPGLLFRRGCRRGPSARAAAQSLSVCIRGGLDKGPQRRSWPLAPLWQKEFGVGGEGGLFPVREESG